MVSLLVGYHKFAGLRRITLPAGGTLRAIYRYAVLNESDSLQRERNFNTQLIRRWAAAEKNLRGTPVTRLCGNIQRRHSVSARQQVPIGPGLEQSAQVIYLAETSGKHQRRKIPVFFNITAQRFRRQQRQKILIATRWQNCVGICSALQKCAKKGRVVSHDRISKKWHVLALRRWRRRMLAKKQSNLIPVCELQGCVQRAPRAGCPLRHQRQTLQHSLNNLRITAIERHPHKIPPVIRASFRMEADRTFKKQAERVDIAIC